MSFNKVIIEGYLGAKPELKITNTNQVPVCNLRVATNEGWTDKQGVKQEKTEWHTVVCYRGLAQTVAQHMDKGRQVLVEGRLQNREFDGPTKYPNGQPVVDANGNPVIVRRYTTEIVAINVQFLGKNPNNTAYPAGTAVAAAPAVIPAAAPAQFVVAAPETPAPVVAADPQAVAGTFVQPITSIPGV